MKDTIVLERTDGHRLVCWVFSDDTPDNFEWRNTFSISEGASWQLEQHLLATRAEGRANEPVTYPKGSIGPDVPGQERSP